MSKPSLSEQRNDVENGGDDTDPNEELLMDAVLAKKRKRGKVSLSSRLKLRRWPLQASALPPSDFFPRRRTYAPIFEMKTMLASVGSYIGV